MELSELMAYASEHYQIEELHKWADFPGFSVLCHPKTGKWIALLMRGWDSDSGEIKERCDLKCGSDVLRRLSKPYLSSPMRMRGDKWVGIRFEAETENDVVLGLFDKAVELENPRGYTVVLHSVNPDSTYSDNKTKEPFYSSSPIAHNDSVPERIRQMKKLYQYGIETTSSRAKNFYKQAVFMADYEDNAPWTGNFFAYFPTYHDLTTQQLRGYFSWRTMVRKGNFQKIDTSAAYIYLYELLNGIDVESPEDCLKKLQEFETGYIDGGLSEGLMRENLRRWMMEYAIVHHLDPEVCREYADPEVIKTDTALSVLKNPADASDEDIYSAVCTFSSKSFDKSPVITLDEARGKHLFSAVWRKAVTVSFEGLDCFEVCFGKPRMRRWYPFSNAVYCVSEKEKDRDYELNPCRSYQCRDGMWNVIGYEKLYFNRKKIQGLLHEADARLRRYLKTGRYLQEKEEDRWAVPIIDAVIEEERKAILEASRPKITIDLSGLDQIRKDAAGTRDSLLTDEEKQEMEEINAAAEEKEPQAEQPSPDSLELQLLKELLNGRDVSDLLKEHHQMPSIMADEINEALIDEIGDIVVVCEDDRLIVV